MRVPTSEWGAEEDGSFNFKDGGGGGGRTANGAAGDGDFEDDDVELTGV
jgi:hypothetical protein